MSYPTPLIDAEGLFEGGNTPPAAYLNAAAQTGAQIPATGAVIVGIGMSNAEIEIRAWQGVAKTDAKIIEGATWGTTVARWDDPAEIDRGWKYARMAVTKAGLKPTDVDAVWMKMAKSAFESPFLADYEAILVEVMKEWSNVKQAWISDAVYRGFGMSPPRRYTSGEPQGGYRAGGEVKKFVQAHMGRTDPFVGWGPYLWANGAQARKDGLVWNRADFQDDGIHVSPSGSAKVAQMLDTHFKTAPGAEWYR